MAVINSWNGGIKIVTQAEIDALRNQDSEADQGQKRFDTCKNRSKDKITDKVKRSCCATTKLPPAYECNRRKIFPLEPAACANCTVYEKK